jgi:hypothetical protein
MSNLKNRKVLCILHRREDEILERKKYEKHPHKKNTKNNAANYIEKFNIPTVSMTMFTW